MVFLASENLLFLRSMQIKVMWACKLGLKDMRDWFWRFKLKKRKHFEDFRFGSMRTWRKKKKKKTGREKNGFFFSKQNEEETQMEMVADGVREGDGGG